MKFLVIGLGVFGTNLAVDLTDSGHEVIAVDRNAETVDRIKDMVSTTYILDTSNEEAVSLLPLSNVDIAIVTIGDNFGASIKTVALLKKMNVKRIMVRASDELHEAILQSMGVERILTPEKKSALNLVNELALNTNVESFAVTTTAYIFKFEAPDFLIGRKYSTLTNDKFYDLRLIAALRPVEHNNIIGIKVMAYRPLTVEEMQGEIQKNDKLTFYGELTNYRKFYKDYSEE